MLKVLRSESRILSIIAFCVLSLFFSPAAGFSVVDNTIKTVDSPDINILEAKFNCCPKNCPRGKRGHRGHRGHKGKSGESFDLPRDDETEYVKFTLRGTALQTTAPINLMPFIILPDQTILLGDVRIATPDDDVVYFTFDSEDSRYSQFLNGPFFGQYLIGWQTSGNSDLDGTVGGQVEVTMSRTPYTNSVLLRSDYIPGQPNGRFAYYISPSVP